MHTTRSASARLKRQTLTRWRSPCLKNTATLRALPTTPSRDTTGRRSAATSVFKTTLSCNIDSHIDRHTHSLKCRYRLYSRLSIFSFFVDWNSASIQLSVVDAGIIHTSPSCSTKSRRFFKSMNLRKQICVRERDRETDRQTDRQTCSDRI